MYLIFVDLAPYMGLPSEHFPEPTVYATMADALIGCEDIKQASNSVTRLRIYKVVGNSLEQVRTIN